MHKLSLSLPNLKILTQKCSHYNSVSIRVPVHAVHNPMKYCTLIERQLFNRDINPFQFSKYFGYFSVSLTYSTPLENVYYHSMIMVYCYYVDGEYDGRLHTMAASQNNARPINTCRLIVDTYKVVT